MHKAQERFCTGEAKAVQVAAVCYRHKAGSIQLLLVRTSSGRWTFPKGRLEEGLSHAQVAALEAFEEAGVEGKVDPRPIGSYLHRKESLRGYRSKQVTVLAFLLEVKRSAAPIETRRTPRWFTLRETKKRLADGRRGKYLCSIERICDSVTRKIHL